MCDVQEASSTGLLIAATTMDVLLFTHEKIEQVWFDRLLVDHSTYVVRTSSVLSIKLYLQYVGLTTRICT